MSSEDSTIRSCEVSLGNNMQKKARKLLQLEPWTFLICSDLGFDSSGVDSISVSSWNEFWENHTIRVCGAVRELPEDAAPFFLDYEVNTFKDFSKQNLLQKVPILSAYSKAAEILGELQKNKILPQKAKKDIAELDLPANSQKTIMALFQTEKGVDSENTFNKIDSILSMVETGKVEPENNPLTVSHNYSNSATQNQAISEILKALEKQISKIADSVMNEDFFRSKRNSWQQLKSFLKTTGRNENVQVYILSKPRKEVTDYLSEINSLTSHKITPDFILWDYSISINTAQLNEFQKTAEIADKYKSILIGSLNYEDQTIKKILDTDSINSLIQQSEYIPFNRLRKNLFTRNVILCLTSAGSLNYDKNQIYESGNWLFAKKWLKSFINNGTPFKISDHDTTDFPSLPTIANVTINDAKTNGITIICANNTETDPNVVFHYEENKAYESLFFNLAVNRIAKITADWVNKNQKIYTADEIIIELKRFLTIELNPYNILSSDEAVSIRKENKSVIVTINSQSTVSGFPLKFQFTVEYIN